MDKILPLKCGPIRGVDRIWGMGNNTIFPTTLGLIRFDKKIVMDFKIIQHHIYSGVFDLSRIDFIPKTYQMGWIHQAYINGFDKDKMNNDELWENIEEYRFFTPDEDENFSFIFSSCHYMHPDVPSFLNGVDTFDVVKDMLENEYLTPHFIGHLGDQVYVDFFSKVAGARSDKEITELYLKSFNHLSKKTIFATYPNLMMLDDHEVDNDFSFSSYYPIGIANEVFRRKHHKTMKHYLRFQAMSTPSYSISENIVEKYYYTCNIQGYPFFWCDCRTYRVKDTTLFGDLQLQELKLWLIAHRTSPIKFIMMSVPPFPDYARDNPGYKDKLSGFPKDRETIFETIAEYSIKGVVICSGDVHFCTGGQIKLYDDLIETPIIVTSIVASPWHWPSLYKMIESSDLDQNDILFEWINERGKRRMFKYLNRRDPISKNNFANIKIVSDNEISVEQIIVEGNKTIITRYDYNI